MQVGVQTTTTTALLEGLFDPGNEPVWRAFDARYRPIIVAFAERLGLGPADADDVAQETLSGFLKDYRAGKYDRERGRLHAWITGIARHRIADVRRARAARRERLGDTAMDELPQDARLSEIWEAECRRAVVAAAMAQLGGTSRLNRKTIEAFRQQVIEQRAPADVAAALGISVRAVYLAKHRCLNRLREIMAELSAAYELTPV